MKLVIVISMSLNLSTRQYILLKITTAFSANVQQNWTKYKCTKNHIKYRRGLVSLFLHQRLYLHQNKYEELEDQIWIKIAYKFENLNTGRIWFWLIQP